MQKHNSLRKQKNHLVDTKLRGAFRTLMPKKCVLSEIFNSKQLYFLSIEKSTMNIGHVQLIFNHNTLTNVQNHFRHIWFILLNFHSVDLDLTSFNKLFTKYLIEKNKNRHIHFTLKQNEKITTK